MNKIDSSEKTLKFCKHHRTIAILAPRFDLTSILTSTIDPTDTIDLSAGAIRGATINPGGLLKVELDTRNSEGVLTRKVTK